MNNNLPALLQSATSDVFPVLVQRESDLLSQARRLFDGGFFDHALLDIWNAAVNNLRRRVEAYGVDIFLSTIKDEPGRKKFSSDGDSLSDRWSGVDDLVLIAGATRLGLLNKKAGKTLEMINWMRNHASPAHESEHSVEQEDVIALAMLLQKNLFEDPLPDPGHSASSLFDPIRSSPLSPESIGILKDQINGLRNPDVRVAFGFMLDLISAGEEPAYSNVAALFPTLWERAFEEIRKTAGLRYHSFTVNPESDESADKGAKDRILYILTQVSGIQFIPDGVRAAIYRRAAQHLATAKNTSYGWRSEEAAARSLAQFGPYVPSISFEEVYQEVLAVWCGNYWGRSTAYVTLTPFIDVLSVDQIRSIGRMFQDNVRVREELFQSKPKAQAIAFLSTLREKVTLEAHKTEIDTAIFAVKQF
jgi:hypothetical protein